MRNKIFLFSKFALLITGLSIGITYQLVQAQPTQSDWEIDYYINNYPYQSELVGRWGICNYQYFGRQLNRNEYDTTGSKTPNCQ
ncbi:MAG: hypothetical protein V7K57_14265 [Nostoc sp.]